MSSRALRTAVLAGALVGLALLGPTFASARQVDPALSADLDGKPMALVDVGLHYCHDLDYPIIHCFSQAKALESEMRARNATSGITAAAGTGVYATVYEYTLFQGAYMHMSQNYTCLACIGWNDRISSFVALNSQTGNFYTDWFYGGTVYGFCCNQQLTGLGSFDNTFSSVYRF
jgi:hypothetical protein